MQRCMMIDDDHTTKNRPTHVLDREFTPETQTLHLNFWSSECDSTNLTTLLSLSLRNSYSVGYLTTVFYRLLVRTGRNVVAEYF